MKLKKLSLFPRNQIQKKRLNIFTIFLISTIILNFTLFGFFNSALPNSTETFNNKENEFDDFDQYPIKTQNGAPYSVLQDPYTINFDKIWNFFESNYLSNFSQFIINTYYREGDSDGDITDHRVYSLDNLLLYNTLKNYVDDLNSSEIYDAYLDLKSTPLWYNGKGEYDYGFIESFDTGSGSKNFKRNLIDNLMPIILLLENIPESPSTEYKNNVNQMLQLINSPQFWNSTNEIFLDYNSSTEDIYAESNLYAVLTLSKLARNNKFNSSVRGMAQDLANKTMITLTEKFWDKTNYGYYYSSDTSLTISDTDKYLQTNAIGILALIEFWLLTDENEYLTNATLIFDKIIESDLRFGNPFYDSVSANWVTATFNELLQDNAFMMKACLKLFDISANISYYNNATAIYETFESNFYNNSANAYDIENSDTDKNLLSNLKLTETYLYAFELYKKTSLNSEFNKSGIAPEFIFDQEQLVIKTNYTFTSNTFDYNIPDASITYQLRYPNNTVFFENSYTTNENGSYIFSYTLDESLPIGDNYLVYIWANTTYFSLANTTMQFTVASGISYISGLEDLSYLFQGERRNITLILNNSRNNDMNLTFSLKTKLDISINTPREIFLNSSELNNVWINFSIINSAELGLTDFYFLLKNGTTVFMNHTIEVEIRNSLYLSQIAYDSEVVEGDILFISINLENFLLNETQSFNLSFLGSYIQDYHKEYTLSEGEAITITKNLNLSSSIKVNSIELVMEISKSNIIFYNRSFTVDVVDKLEVLEASFPSRVAQLSRAYFVLELKNNKRASESFSLYINGKLIQSNELIPGDNRIEASFVPTYNPYDFSVKKYHIVLKDSTGNEQLSFYYEVQTLISVMNLVLFYILPIIIPIAILLYFKNKEMKTKLLRR